PHVTPFNYAENRPISGVDLHGLQYLDHNLKFQMDQTSITVTGELTVGVKILNLSSEKISQEAIDFHMDKASSVFDASYWGVGYSSVSFNPNSGELFSDKMNLYAKNLDINFEYTGTITSLNGIEKGDVVMALVDDLKGEIHGKAGEGAGFAYLVEAGVFNEKNKVPTHEFGHGIGGLLDIGKAGYERFLMAFNKSGDGYELRNSDRTDIVYTLIYNAGRRKYVNQPASEVDTRKLIQDMLDRFSKN
ncbi:MAG TPA: hypothetical protein VJ951_09830, partial [Bacteroidales bacterium]|nr:hypothetical protein [Bacteroidales bacterium]